MGWLVLAAGQSRRFGADKLTAQMRDGRALLAHTLAALTATEQPLLAVVRPGHNAVTALLDRLDVPYTVCPHAEAGMGASLAWGVSQVKDWMFCGVALADMPYIRSGTLAALHERGGEERIVAPFYHERQGHPVIFGRRFYPQLMALGGDAGAKSVLQRYSDALLRLDVEDRGVLCDVDTPDDIHEARQEGVAYSLS
ncbi:uncharacterized MobA-related protein [Hahella chejuensis KCTC 2396]|uniref:Uncharacterized MobA-related protein n=1 Tax=Hahella chejuensis (strain KCTC 2396) TaxID=349521 RepID=Q2SCA6_HAHCH|nr:nucleotidyltransferase family protein [Hahella chejuensis]ABC31718.1 uncharacterized MobA-related protein [Hahella chejuensis KCTC 2396]